MNVFPKFIIETTEEKGDCLIISKCTFHKNIAIDESKVKGGGWFRIENKTMIFYGTSYDFGSVKIDDLKKAIKDKKVYTNNRLSRSIADDYKFYFDTNLELINLN